MSLAARARMRPVLYPAAILVAFVLNFLIETGVSPYASGRPLILAILIGLALPWLAGLVTGDRNRAGLVGGVLALLLLAAQAPIIVLLGLAALVLVGLQWWLARRRAETSAAGERMWPIITRVLTAGALILLVAVGIKAVQLGRADTVAHDLLAEFPLRAPAAVATSQVELPNMYFILLDGYPRADKLASEFGIDVSGFTRALDDRGFFVATHSRSNHTITHLTLTQMFSYGSGGVTAAGADGVQRVLWRHRINQGAFFSDIRDLGYDVVAISPAFEHVALRQADRFIDTGQVNELEWAIIQVTGIRPLVEFTLPSLAADLHRARVAAAFEVTGEVAGEAASSPRFVFTHIVSPHSPQAFNGDGTPVDLRGFVLPYGDGEEIEEFGWEEYVRRLEGQLAFLDAQVVTLVDDIVAADPQAVVVVFSDHGSGAGWSETDPQKADVDLRTANLLAVRSPGHTDIVDDRSTLANLLPRLLRAYAGAGPPDIPETIYAWADDPRLSRVFVRPD